MPGAMKPSTHPFPLGGCWFRDFIFMPFAFLFERVCCDKFTEGNISRELWLLC